jgi:sugar-specific transcriptional regulator TrmB
MREDLEQRIRLLELELEKLKEENKQSSHTWIWAFVPILALCIPVLAILRDTFQ